MEIDWSEVEYQTTFVAHVRNLPQTFRHYQKENQILRLFTLCVGVPEWLYSRHGLKKSSFNERMIIRLHSVLNL